MPELHHAPSLPASIRKIAVVGPGIVGMPMAALLADAAVRTRPTTRVMVVQRRSPTSGWKVDAINAGKSPIGGVEPSLDSVVADTVRAGVLSATHDYAAVRDADLILIAVQTDKAGTAPDYGPLMEALGGIAEALQQRPAGHVATIVFESTLAPSSMQSVIRPFFERYGLREGKEIWLANSPNRVMPGRLVERVAAADKIVGALHRETAARVAAVYACIVTQGRLLQTNSLTAEVVKTLENAYRDVRIAFAAETVRYCDRHDIDFFALRDQVNTAMKQTDTASGSATAVPTGALLVPTVGVGGHCLPKDGILLWWRARESAASLPPSLILGARGINDQAPAITMQMATEARLTLRGARVAVLGAAYRFDSEDTRNSPSLALANLLRDAGAEVALHDPHVRPDDVNLRRLGLTDVFTSDVAAALKGAEVVFMATGHAAYRPLVHTLAREVPTLRLVVDACNMFSRRAFTGSHVRYVGIGRGHRAPDELLVRRVSQMFRAVERGVANEVSALCDFLNTRYADGAWNRVAFDDVQRLAGTCVTGCDIVDPGPVDAVEFEEGIASQLVQLAVAGSRNGKPGATRSYPSKVTLP